MRLIELGERLYAVGLDWEVSPFGPLHPREVRAHARRLRATHGVEGPPAPGHLHVSHGYGRLPPLPRGERRQPASLACAVAAATTGAAMFVLPLAQGEAVFIGILSGQPAPGCDLVGTEAEVAAAVARFAEANGVFQLGYAPAFGRPDFLRGVDLRPLAWEDDAGQGLRPIGGRAPVAVFAATGLLAAAALVAGAHHLRQQQDPAWARQQPQGPDAGALYRQSRDAAFHAHSPVPVAAAAPVLLGGLLGMPVADGGWALVRVACRHARGTRPAAFDCSARWDNRSGNFRSFAVPAGTAVDYTDNLSGLTTRWQVPLPQVAAWDLALLDRLPAGAAATVETGSPLQDLAALPEVKAGMTAATLVGATSDPAVRDRLLRGTWTLQGPADLLRELAAGLPPHLTLDSLEVAVPPPSAAGQPDALPQLTLQGGFHVRQQP